MVFSTTTQTFFKILLSIVIVFVVLTLSWQRGNNATVKPAYLSPKVNVFMLDSSDPVSLKKQRDLMAAHDIINLFITTQEDQKSLLASEPDTLKRYVSLVELDQAHLAVELWKFSAFIAHGGGLYLDAESPLLVSIEELLYYNSNIAVVSDYFENTIHGSMILMKSASAITIAERIVKLMVEIPIQTLIMSPLLIPKKLYKEIEKENHGIHENKWHLYKNHCIMDPLQKGRKLSNFQVDGSNWISHYCPRETGYCCQVYDVSTQTTILMTKHPILPYQILLKSLSKPFNLPNYDGDDLPFLSTITQKIHKRPSDAPVTPNFYDTLFQNDCLPSNLQCNICLRDKKGADCKKCKHVCPCFCKTLCYVSVDEKFVTKELIVTPPFYSRDPDRLVPKIIHQTWFEDVSKEKYPNMSRLTESFKQSGWEYKFYTDDIARDILLSHFPKEVLEAYDALRPGAFKADLFRYCVLLIYGGVYADMDVMLESNLDAAISSDVGFMVPVDEPGKPVGKRMCLWNGFIAAAPAHPFLAKAIETVVNNIRNRFTSVDVDATFCPDPELSVLHAFDTLFTAGPCILGSVVNKVLGRHGQMQFEAGEIDPWINPTQSATKTGNAVVRKLDKEPRLRIPGRTIILNQNKWDMGAHRFTLLEKNLVVAATDMPDYDDRKSLEEKEHYSKTHVKAGIYGLDKLYINNKKADEDIHILIDARYSKHKEND